MNMNMTQPFLRKFGMYGFNINCVGYGFEYILLLSI